MSEPTTTPDVDETDEAEITECAHCGCDLDEDYANYVEGIGDVCDECEHELTHECMLCCERVPIKKTSDFIVVPTVLTRLPKIHGIYRVLDYPFLLGSMIGNTSLMDYKVTFVARLPKPDREFETGGYLCNECAAPYEKTFKKAYRGAEPKKLFSTKRTQREKELMAAALKAHPEILQEFETDQINDLAEIEETYGIENPVCHHEWLYREHKGVKIYHSYFPSTPEDRAKPSWLVLDPAPKNRGCRGATTFDASGLPNFPMDAYLDLGTYHPEKARICWETIQFAIDCGAITQTGVARHDDPIWKACRTPEVPKKETT